MNDLMENTITIAISNRESVPLPHSVPKGITLRLDFFSKSGESLSKALIMFTRLLYFEYINNVARECSFFLHYHYALFHGFFRVEVPLLEVPLFII